ncbi:hypothetical protein JAAARDRAFT_702680 [Jaapia argillacea MUCL 33604]|uniref:indole-3-glycerol-phosphate synthase n=1 Tax=Jaapia argillacea MUCL 33604 TaxID=933084 RepID=A0A067PCC4_9AGAM|nr:hypothetical protein JAAARDRAFT_702680 [Jaapia argillacea MUCL 33604]
MPHHITLITCLFLNLAPPLIPILLRMQSSITPAKNPALMADIRHTSPPNWNITLNTHTTRLWCTPLGSTQFKGSLFDMQLMRQAINGCLHSASTILLIITMLSPAQLGALYHFSPSLGMEPLVEVDNATEMSLFFSLPTTLIRVNNHDLHGFHVIMDTTTRLADMVKGKDVMLCALSEIMGRGDVEKYLEEWVGAVLVGELLMRVKDTPAFIQKIRAGLGLCCVEINGVVTPEQTVKRANTGATLIGVHLSLRRKNRVSVKPAAAILLMLRKVHSRFSTLQDHHQPLLSHLGMIGIFDDDITLEEIFQTIIQFPPPLYYSSQIPVYTIRTLQGTSNSLSLTLAQIAGYCHLRNSDAAKSISKLNVPLVLSIIGDNLAADKVQEIDGQSVDGGLVGSFIQAVQATDEGSPW